MAIAAEICVYTNTNIVVESLDFGALSTIDDKTGPTTEPMTNFLPAKSSPNSTATSSARTTPSAPSPSRCAIAGGASS